MVREEDRYLDQMTFPARSKRVSQHQELAVWLALSLAARFAVSVCILNSWVLPVLVPSREVTKPSYC